MRCAPPGRAADPPPRPALEKEQRAHAALRGDLQAVAAGLNPEQALLGFDSAGPLGALGLLVPPHGTSNLLDLHLLAIRDLTDTNGVPVTELAANDEVWVKY